MPPPAESLAPALRASAQVEYGPAVEIPDYLESVYWWAYVRPKAVRLFERAWLVNAILFGHYGRLRDQALAELGDHLHGETLQVACVYGDLTARLRERLAPDGRLEVVDVLPVQLENMRAKLPVDDRVTLTQGDASALGRPTASVDRLLLFFLLHEMPDAVRRATLAEALRVVRPGGKIVIVDYHRPVGWHPLRPVMAAVFGVLEPFAKALWRDEIWSFLPDGRRPGSVRKQTWFGGLYQLLSWTR